MCDVIHVSCDSQESIPGPIESIQHTCMFVEVVAIAMHGKCGCDKQPPGAWQGTHRSTTCTVKIITVGHWAFTMQVVYVSDQQSQ